MILRVAAVVGDPPQSRDVVVTGRVIAGAGGSDGPLIELGDTIAFPGLINSHDHLEMNLYPALAGPRYPDYLSWGSTIHRQHAATIATIEKLPRWVRVRWGVLKNLIGGVTSVAHHAEHPDFVDPAVGTLPGTSIHSVQLGRRWRRRLNSPLARAPYVVHVGEGTTPAMRLEIDTLTHWNLWHRELIAVHGIAMRPGQARRFRGLVWCPLSNDFLYGATADVGAIKDHCAVVLGTDSTLTASWNIWHHLRETRRTGVLTDPELFAAVTSGAARLWNLVSGEIRPGRRADLVVARRKHEQPWQAFFETDPEDILLVLRAGAPVLVDAEITHERLRIAGPSATVRVRGRVKHVALNLDPVLAALRTHGVSPNLEDVDVVSDQLRS